MSTTTSGLSELHEVALFSITDQLHEVASGGRDQISPAELNSLLQDICLDNRCRVCDLPSVLVGLYEDAHKRLTDTSGRYGCVNFSLMSLVESVKRAL